jgi:membrane-associated protease RseP (regulator of RpoE activity)
MQKGTIGILAILVLFLAAADVRLSERVRVLEDQLAARPRPRPVPASPPEPASVPDPAPVSAAAPIAKGSETPPSASKPAPSWNLLDARDPRLEELKTREQKFVRAQTGTAVWSFDTVTGSLTLQQPPAPEPESLAGPRPGFLGITGEDVPGGGVKINGLIPDSVAMRSGLQPEDIILEYNGERVDSLAALSTKIRGAAEGTPASLRIRRNGVDFYQGVQLGASRR